MDLVSHAVVGAGAALSVSPRARVATATAAVGAIASLAPDLDLLIASSTDPLLYMEAHRQFTHSFAFAPVGALLCALAIHPWARRRLSAPSTYGACLIGLLSHALLDACTSFGTELFWPVSDARVALSIIALFDPAFTAPAAMLVLLAVLRKRRLYARAAAGWAVAYLALGVVQHERAAAVAAGVAAGRGHSPVRLEVTPALGSLLLWKSIYEHDGRYHVDGVRVGLRTRAYPGESIAKLDVSRAFPQLALDAQQARDIERFSRISDGLVAVDPAHSERIVDLRYSLVPNEIAGFWAIVVDPQADVAEHVEVVATREDAPRQARRLLTMLFSGNG
jgi:inner membrane protein